MTESTNQPQRPPTLVEAVLGKQAAEARERATELQLREAEAKLAHDQRGRRISIILYLVFIVACIFGLAMGCLAMWNAVVG